MDNILEMDFDINGSDLNLRLSGRLDTLWAAQLDAKLNELPPEVSNIYFDMEGLEYIASAGLRILYWAVEYTDEKGGETKVKNASSEVRKVFAITGFNQMLDFD